MTLRDDIADLQSRLEEAERTQRTPLAHREEYRLLVTSFMPYLELHLDLVEEVRRERGPAPGISRRPA